MIGSTRQVTVCFTLAFVAEAIGLAAIVGAFAAGFVMPTLVAASVAPMKRWTSSGLSGSSHAVTPQPSATGATTPSTATRRAEGPTRMRARRVGLQTDLEE